MTVAGGSWLETSVTSKQLDTQKEEKNAIPIIIIQQQHEPQSLKQRTRLVDEVPVPSKSKQYVSSNSPITYHDHRLRFQTAQMTANQNQITNLGSTSKKLISKLTRKK